VEYGSGEEMLQSGGGYFPRDEQEQLLTDPHLLDFQRALCTPLFEEIIQPAREMRVSPTELALLKVFSFCGSIPTGISPAGGSS